jgi:beta-galactosidase
VEPIEGDLVFIDVSMVDENGNFVPTADDQLEFDVTGNGEFKAVCNGDATSLESFTQPRMRLFSGRVVLIVRRGAGSEPFTINVRTVDGTLSGSVNVRVE